MTKSTLPSNQELVQKRLQVAKEKKEARERSVQKVQERNMHIKDLMQGGETVAMLYAIKVSVGRDLREELKLSGREKRGRVFIEPESKAVSTLQGLRFELHSFFRALRKGSFLLSAGYPQLDTDGSIKSTPLDNSFWKIESDEDVVKTFQAADDFFAKNSDVLKRPSIVLQVERDPNAPARPPLPSYLIDLPDPTESETMTMLSFYSFPPEGIDDLEAFATQLRKQWKPFGALGRVYVAQEGVNAQMSVPTNVLDRFMDCCRSIPQLGEHMENGINVDPKLLSRDEFAIAGLAAGEPSPPFTNLHVRVRSQILADGLDEALNWQSAGYDMPPLEWHAKLKEQKDNGEAPIILDCRNTYESNVGRFEGAEPVGTENFRDTWEVLEERLKDTPKDAPIYGYCTGGIRCVKVGAYLTQRLGFTNVSRLAGGIIAYDRTLQEKVPEEKPLFKGTNFVFDGRLGRPITDDALGTCLTCGGKTSLVSNCRNPNCHQRMIQCETCRTTFLGTCSDACRQRLVNGVRRPESENSSTIIPAQFQSLDDYSNGHSSPTPSAYKEMEFNTKALIPSGAHMVSGRSQGQLLTQFASMSREGRVLELGTFTGYATACLLEGSYNAGKAMSAMNGNPNGGPFVLSMERDLKAYEVAVAHLRILSKYGTTGDAAAEALCALRHGDQGVPAVTEDSVALDYRGVAGCELRRVTDALAALESMASTDDNGVAPFDLVFVDADKTRLLDYAEACLSTDRILKKGGHIIVDNVLWKGLVVEAAQGDFSSSDDDDETDDQLRKNRRARKLANTMHRFNRAIVEDPRVEVLVLPVRDGLSVIRKR